MKKFTLREHAIWKNAVIDYKEKVKNNTSADNIAQIYKEFKSAVSGLGADLEPSYSFDNSCIPRRQSFIENKIKELQYIYTKDRKNDDNDIRVIENSLGIMFNRRITFSDLNQAICYAVIIEESPKSLKITDKISIKMTKKTYAFYSFLDNKKGCKLFSGNKEEVYKKAVDYFYKKINNT